jgi:putative acetyltransferase
MELALESPDQPDVLRLIDELDAYQKPLYPEESHHGIDLDAMLDPSVAFAVARAGGAAIGCGAVVVIDGYAELKRMYVDPDRRGAGIGRALLQFLEREASTRGATVARLETGIHQHAAIAMYERAGYGHRGPFGAYTDDPVSVFMEKVLVPTP